MGRINKRKGAFRAFFGIRRATHQKTAEKGPRPFRKIPYFPPFCEKEKIKIIFFEKGVDKCVSVCYNKRASHGMAE